MSTRTSAFSSRLCGWLGTAWPRSTTNAIEPKAAAAQPAALLPRERHCLIATTPSAVNATRLT
jgi:hypothetical protein